jgi:hypothetical protein
MVRLGAEPGRPVLIIGVLRAQQLDRYSPVNGQVSTPPDIPHTAGRNERIQPVAVPQYKPGCPHVPTGTLLRDDHSSDPMRTGGSELRPLAPFQASRPCLPG